MAVIRSLMVKIGADLTGFEKTLTAASRNLDKWGKKAVSSGRAMTTAFTVPIVAVGASIAALAVKTAEYGDKMTTLAGQTGISVQALQELEYVATQADVEFEALTGSMSKFTLRMKEAMDPTSKMGKLFNALGVSMTDENGVLKRREDLFMEVIDATGKITDETMQATVASDLFGRSFADLLPLMKLGADGLKRIQTEYKRLGIAMSDEQIANMDKFADKMEAVKIRVRNSFFLMAASNQIAFDKMVDLAENKLIPAFGKIVEKTGKLAESFMNLDPQTQKFLLWTTGVVAVAGPVVAFIGNLSTALAGLGTSLAGFLSAAKGLIPALGPLAYLAIPLGLADSPAMKAWAANEKKWASETTTPGDMETFNKEAMKAGKKISSAMVSGGAGSDSQSVNSMMSGLESFYKGLEDGITKFGETGADAMKDFASSIKGVIDAIRSQTDAFANFTGLFDIFERKYVSGDRLMNRLKAQVKAMGEWQNSLVTIQAKGVSEQFLQTLRMMGPGAVDQVNALARMSPEQLQQYEGLYNQKAGIAGTQAGWAQQAQTYIENQINLEISGNNISSDSDTDRIANQIIGKLRYAGIRI